MIESYLPEQLSEEAIRKVVHQIATESGASSMRDMGKVMGPSIAKMKGLADGKLVQEIVKSVLSEL